MDVTDQAHLQEFGLWYADMRMVEELCGGEV